MTPPPRDPLYDWQCGFPSKKMKGPCALYTGHHGGHESRRTQVNEDTPRMKEFARIVNAALDDGVYLSYVEIAEIMGHPNLRSVAQYGLGSRYTKLRQKIYAARGIKREEWRGRSPEQVVLRELKLKGIFQ